MLFAKIALALSLLAQNYLITYTEPNCLEVYGAWKPASLIFGKTNNVKILTINDSLIKLTSEGFFIFGFDRDDTGNYCIKAYFNDNNVDSICNILEKRNYKTQAINNMDEKYVFPPKEMLERIEKEAQLIKNSRLDLSKTDSAYFLNGFFKPTEGRISSVFGSQRILNGVKKSPHNGVDISAMKGVKVCAMSGGRVILVGNLFYYGGNMLIIDHGFGLTSSYLHLNSINVKEGDQINKGDIIGFVGSTGRSTGPHLHWGAQWYDKRIDPLEILKLKFE